jgi:hypothetical protein
LIPEVVTVLQETLDFNIRYGFIDLCLSKNLL